jgi:tRNA threonylcarbamoyladenosine modification (KEOPS) complex  Pcc1 subunit
MKASIEVDFPSEKAVNNAIASLEQETLFKKEGRSRLKKKGKSLIIEIEADNAVVLKAMMNSYMRLLQIIEGINKIE